MTLCFVFIGNYLHSRFKIAGGGGQDEAKTYFFLSQSSWSSILLVLSPD